MMQLKQYLENYSIKCLYQKLRKVINNVSFNLKKLIQEDKNKPQTMRGNNKEQKSMKLKLKNKTDH